MSEPVKSIEDIADDKRRKSSVDLTLDFLDTTQYDYEEALQQTGFGKFHLFLLAICGLIYLNTAIGKVGKYTFLVCCENVTGKLSVAQLFSTGITILSFVLPSATCGECKFTIYRLVRQ